MQILAVAKLFEEFQEKFLDFTHAKVIVVRLYDKHVVSQAKMNEINDASDDYNANSILFNHIKTQGTYDVAETLFRVMISMKGYSQMSSLGQEMLQYLCGRECETTYSMICFA